MKEVTKLADFSGKTIFCGADVHKGSWSICLMMEDQILKRFSQSPRGEVLEKTLKRLYPGARYKAVYEAGFCGFSPQRQLTELEIDCIVVNAADVPTMNKEKQQKSDPVDCGKLARSLSAGMLTPIHIPSVQQQDDRCLVRNYLQFVKDQTRCKNRISGALYFQGITPQLIEDEKRPTYWSKNYIRRLKELSMATPQARKSLDLLIQSYEYTRRQVLDTTRELHQLALEDRYKDQIALIRSVPGIGQIGALLLLTEIGDFNRFRGIDQLCCYIGLIPNTQSSGEHDRTTGLSYRGHPKLREILIEASWIAIRQDPALTLAFSNYGRKMKKNQAIIKIAKKVLSRVRFVMKHQKPYVSGVVE